MPNIPEVLDVVGCPVSEVVASVVVIGEEEGACVEEEEETSASDVLDVDEVAGSLGEGEEEEDVAWAAEDVDVPTVVSAGSVLEGAGEFVLVSF